MKPQPATSPLDQLVRQIREETGNLVSPSRLQLLEEAALRRARSRGLPDLAAYVQTLAAGGLPEEWGFLISLVTIKESYFLRAPQQLEAIRREVMPVLLRARQRERRLRIWSAACARGEEPSTLAIQLLEDPALAGWDWSILATDLDEEALGGARSGLYGDRAVAQLPADLLTRYFTPRGKLFELSAAVRERIHYRPLNLARPPFELPGAPFDLILLRNVLIYFRRSLQRRVVEEVERALAADGFLFLGTTETLWPAPGGLAAREIGGCFAYLRDPAAADEATGGVAGAARRAVGAREGEIRAPASPPSLLYPPAPPIAAPLPPDPERAAPERGSSLADAVRSVSEERFAEAEAEVEAVLAQTPSDPQAHALRGFLSDVLGDAPGAVAAYRAALYLEPGLFQVRLLLADCLQRRGEGAAAERQYREVLTLLASGRGRELAALAPLPVPDRERAERRSRQALGGG